MLQIHALPARMSLPDQIGTLPQKHIALRTWACHNLHHPTQVASVRYGDRQGCLGITYGCQILRGYGSDFGLP